MFTGKIFCTVVEVPADQDVPPRYRPAPHDLLPWADPYIAQLMHKLHARLNHEPGSDQPLEYHAEEEPEAAAFHRAWSQSEHDGHLRFDRLDDSWRRTGWPLLDDE